VKVVVTIPTYNEIENIERLAKEILALDERFELLVADDDSPDGTWREVARLRETEPRIHLLHRTTDRGRGSAGRDAFVWAIDHGADVIFEMDADFSHQPRFMPAMLESLGTADVVLGSRQVRGGKDIGRPILRVWLTHMSNLFVRIVLWLPARDCNSGFRVFRRSALLAVDVASTFSTGPDIVHEVLYKAHLKRLTIAEVPIDFVERKRGSSTLTFATLLRSYVSVLRLKWLGITGRIFDSAA
jgi:dolichol-phosphate mannosyltransferase